MSVKPSGFYDFVVPANGAFMLTVIGDYFKIMASSGQLSVKSDTFELKRLIAGQGLEDNPFQRLYITDDSGAPNTVRMFIGDRKFIDGMSGSVQVAGGTIGVSSLPAVAVSSLPAVEVSSLPAVAVSSLPVPIAVLNNFQQVVTNASTIIINARPGRRYLLIQNRDAAADVFIAFGKSATTAAGVRIVPGGVFELVGVITEQAIHAIGSAASNTNVTTVEG